MSVTQSSPSMLISFVSSCKQGPTLKKILGFGWWNLFFGGDPGLWTGGAWSLTGDDPQVRYVPPLALQRRGLDSLPSIPPHSSAHCRCWKSSPPAPSHPLNSLLVRLRLWLSVVVILSFPSARLTILSPPLFSASVLLCTLHVSFFLTVCKKWSQTKKALVESSHICTTVKLLAFLLFENTVHNPTWS